jgi:hypothetical protein
MSEITADDEALTEIETICQGECPSITGRSVLTYALGRHPEDATLHLRIVANSGGGMFCKDWTPAMQIDAIVIGEEALTAKAFHVLHEGRSINTGGFVLAVVRDLGLIRANADNSRLHEHVPTTTMEQVSMVRMGQASESAPKAGRRKAKEG